MMFWIDAMLLLVCGWMGGTVSTLIIRYVMEGRKPIDRRMMPERVPTLALPPLPSPPEFSPYAPKAKPERNSPNTDALKKIWRAAKKEQSTRWNTKEVMPADERKTNKRPENRPASDPPVRATSPDLLPTVPWGG